MASADSRVKSELPGGDPALMNRVAWARRWNDRETSTQYAKNALQTASDGHGRRSRTEQGYALRTLAWHARWRGEFDTAMEYCLKAENFLSETDHPETRASIYATLGMTHYVRGRMDLAISALDRGIWLMRDLPEGEGKSNLADLLVVRGSVQQQGGERARAGMTFNHARELASEEDKAYVYYKTARWLFGTEAIVRALQYAENSLDSAKKNENRIILPYIYRIMGACHARQKNEIEALSYFKDGIDRAEEDQDQRALCHLHLSQAQFELARGNVEKARDLLIVGSAIAKRQNMPLFRKNLALALADVFEELGQFKASVDQHKLAWRLEREGRNR